MRKPEQTTEPSIEEILASIRRIIADEGGPMAPAFDQGGADMGAPQRSHSRHQSHYDEHQDNGAHYEEPRTRSHSDDHDPRYGEPRYDDRRFNEARHEEPRYQEPRHMDAPQRGPQPRGYAPEPQQPEYQEHQRRADFRDHRSHDDYENGYDARARHPNYQERDGVGSDFDRGHDYGRDADFRRDGFEHGDARHDYDADAHAATNFDPYATEDDFGATKSIRPAGNDDEILELTEDFMVEEVASDEGDTATTGDEYNGNYQFQPDENTVASDYAPFNDFNDPKFDFTIPKFDLSPVADGSDDDDDNEGDDKSNDYFGKDEEPAAQEITATMSPVTEDTFANEGLDSVLSNVVAEMQRLSEGKGLGALLEGSVPAAEAEKASHLEGMPSDEPQLRTSSWQPKARQASAPTQRPVWSARRLDGEGSGAEPHTASPQAPQSRERSVDVASAMGAPFAEAMEPKPAAPKAQSQGTAPTLARNANLRVEVEEIMPDLPEGDFPPETSGSDEARPRSKTAVDTQGTIRARKVETTTVEEPPELPSEEDVESVVQPAPSPAPKVKQPQTRAPEPVVAALASVAPSKTAPAPTQPNTPEAGMASAPVTAPVPADRKPASPQVSGAAKAAVEGIAAALPDGLEDGVREMLKPLIAEWLKENLPRITEEVLREEMQSNNAPGKRSGKA